MRRLGDDYFVISTDWSPELQHAIRCGMALQPEYRPQTISQWLTLLPSAEEAVLMMFNIETVQVDQTGEYS